MTTNSKPLEREVDQDLFNFLVRSSRSCCQLVIIAVVFSSVSHSLHKIFINLVRTSSTPLRPSSSLFSSLLHCCCHELVPDRDENFVTKARWNRVSTTISRRLSVEISPLLPPVSSPSSLFPLSARLVALELIGFRVSSVINFGSSFGDLRDGNRSRREKEISLANHWRLWRGKSIARELQNSSRKRDRPGTPPLHCW